MTKAAAIKGARRDTENAMLYLDRAEEDVQFGDQEQENLAKAAARLEAALVAVRAMQEEV